MAATEGRHVVMITSAKCVRTGYHPVPSTIQRRAQRNCRHGLQRIALMDVCVCVCIFWALSSIVSGPAAALAVAGDNAHDLSADWLSRLPSFCHCLASFFFFGVNTLFAVFRSAGAKDVHAHIAHAHIHMLVRARVLQTQLRCASCWA